MPRTDNVTPIRKKADKDAARHDVIQRIMNAQGIAGLIRARAIHDGGREDGELEGAANAIEDELNEAISSLENV